MQKTNFDKGRAERLKKLEKFKEKPVKHPGQGLGEPTDGGNPDNPKVNRSPGEQGAK